jgi:hypothetical protein
MEGGVSMIQETCTEIGALERHWVAEKRARTARRDRIHAIDQLIEEFEKLNLADEAEIPVELSGRAHRLVLAERHPIARRTPNEVDVAEWMDALYDVQDTLMFSSAEEE